VLISRDQFKLDGRGISIDGSTLSDEFTESRDNQYSHCFPMEVKYDGELAMLTRPPKTDPDVKLGSGKGEGQMPRKRYTPEQIISKLREAEVLLSQGETVAQATKQLGVSEQTYYRWRKEYGGMRTSQVRKLKELEKENARLKKLVADLSLDNAILKEAI
jgi:putative transposase